MKVALVHNFHAADVPSGENAVVEAEAAALERAGIDVRVAGVWNDELAARPANQLRAAAAVTTGIGISPLRLLGDFCPDVIHVHSLFPYLGRRWLSRAPAPVIATLHSYRAVCANGYLYRDGAVCTLCLDGHPWAGVRHRCYRGSALATVPLAVAARGGVRRDPLLRAARRLLVLSDRARAVFETAGVPPEQLVTDWHFLPDALDPGVGTDRTDAWLFVGRLTPEKGIDRLVAEWPPNARLRVIGDGPLRPSLEALAAGKAIEFLGQRPRLDVVEEMRRGFGLVFPSRWYETFGLTYMEALACGLPTLAFPPNAVADRVAADGTGSVAAWGDVPAAIALATSTFEARRARCRAVFEARYTEAAFLARRGALYGEVLAAPPARSPGGAAVT